MNHRSPHAESPLAEVDRTAVCLESSSANFASTGAPASPAGPAQLAPPDSLNPVASPQRLDREPPPQNKPKHSVSTSTVFSLLDQVFVSGASFAASVVIGRTDAGILGVYALAMTLVNFFRAIQGELITAPYMVYRQQRQQHRRGKGSSVAVFDGSVMIHQCVATLAGMVFVLAAGVSLTWIDAPHQLSSALTVLVCTLPPVLWLSFARHYCFAKLRFGLATIVDGAVGFAQLTGLLLLASLGMMSVENVFLAIGAATGLGVLIWILGWRGRPVFQLAAARDDWRSNWRFARWALASQLIGCSTPFVLPWAISFTRGEYDTGVFAACVTTMGLSSLFVTAVGNLLTPLAARGFAEGGATKLRSILTKATLAFLAVLGGFCLFVLLTGDWLVVLFYGGDYAGTGNVCSLLAAGILLNSLSVIAGNGLWALDRLFCSLLAAGILLNSLSVIAGNGLWALDRPSWNLPGDTAVLIVTVIASVVLIPAQGIAGAAMATFCGAVAGAVLRLATLQLVLRSLEPSP